MDNLEIEILRKIKRVMKEKNVTQESLARQLDIPQYQVSRYLNGKPFPPMQVLVDITQILDISLYYLFGIEGESYRELSTKKVKLVEAYNDANKAIKVIIDKILDI